MANWNIALFDPQHLSTWGVMGSLALLMLISFFSATLLPLGSEPALVAFLIWQPQWCLAALCLATLGNTGGGLFNWWMGRGAKAQWRKKFSPTPSSAPLNWIQVWAQQTLDFLGPKGLMLSWLPLVGDPMCVLAGWLEWDWRACLGYMSLGKGLRYGLISWASLGSHTWAESIANSIGMYI